MANESVPLPTQRTLAVPPTRVETEIMNGNNLCIPTALAYCLQGTGRVQTPREILNERNVATLFLDAHNVSTTGLYSQQNLMEYLQQEKKIPSLGVVFDYGKLNPHWRKQLEFWLDNGGTCMVFDNTKYNVSHASAIVKSGTQYQTIDPLNGERQPINVLDPQTIPDRLAYQALLIPPPPDTANPAMIERLKWYYDLMHGALVNADEKFKTSAKDIISEDGIALTIPKSPNEISLIATQPGNNLNTALDLIRTNYLERTTQEALRKIVVAPEDLE